MTTDTFQFRLPDLGEGLSEAQVVAWHVSAGAHVVAGQPLVSVETDKAVVEIPAPRSGIVHKIYATLGQHIHVGDLLVGYESQVSDLGTVVGELTPATDTHHGAITPLKATPKARALARDLGVDLNTIAPSGPQDTILPIDVTSAATTPEQMSLTGVRKSMAKRMASAHAQVAHATVTGQADITGWKDNQKTLARMIRAVGKACEAEPKLNAHFDGEHFQVIPQPQVHLGIAMETEDGLFVPVSCAAFYGLYE